MRNDFNELNAAEMFLQVVDSGSFAGAARVLGHNPSTLTRAVSELEKRLGAVLLNRTTRRLHLTEAGQAYSEHARAMLGARQNAYEAVAALGGGQPRGVLRVSMPTAMGDVLVEHLPRFRARYPELRLDFDLSDRIQPLVEGGFDLAIRYGPLPDSTLRAQKLGEIHTGLYASPGYIAAHGAPLTPEDLQRHVCLTSGRVPGPVLWSFWRDGVCTEQSITGWVHCTNIATVMRMVLADMGIARLLGWMAEPLVREGVLLPVLGEWRGEPPGQGVPLNIVFVPGAASLAPLKARVFAEFVRDCLGEVFERDGE